MSGTPLKILRSIKKTIKYQVHPFPQYEGEIEVYLPDGIDTSKLKDGQNVQVLAGPGMTMSLPPQLMNCQEIKIIE